jgi:hypothetical protein
VARPHAPRLLAVALALASCGGRGGGVGLSAQGAQFAATILSHGVALDASGRNCAGLYGRWEVRLRVSGRAKGSGTTRFALRPGRVAVAPISFRIRVGFLRGHANGVLRVRAERGALVVRGRIKVEVPFKSVSQTVSETIPVTRGPVPGCGLAG